MARTTGLFKETFANWTKDEVTTYSAALAYYAIFSIAPLLLIAIFIAGLVYGRAGAQEQLMGQVSQAIGEQGAAYVGKMIQAASRPSAGIVASIIGLVTLFLGATRIFTQLKDMLNRIWGAQAASGIKGFLMGKLTAFLMVFLFGILFLVLTVASTAATTLIHTFGSRLGMPWLWQFGATLLTVAVFTLLFAMIYKWLPDIKIAWRDVWVGALVTAVLFAIGKYLLGLYLSRGSVASPYGAAGSLVVLLVFFYYIALIFFTGAEFTESYSRCYGSRQGEGNRRQGAEAPPEGGTPEREPRRAALIPGPRPATTPGGIFAGMAAFLVWRRLFRH